MTTRDRYGAAILLCLGYIVTAASAVRLYYSYEVLWKSWDITWYLYPTALAGIVETNLAIVSLRIFEVETWIKVLTQLKQ